MRNFKFRLDRTGFPMLWVAEIDAYIHWYPVTKIQIERFICTAQDSEFDADWYDAILDGNKRVSPHAINDGNYWQAFVTNIFPQEARLFARWSGAGYSLPTYDEWFTAYKTLKQEDANSTSPMLDEIQGRAKTVVTRVDQANREAARSSSTYTLADQMLMRMGVLEWVDCKEQRSRWGGMGKLPPEFHNYLLSPEQGPSQPNNPETRRIFYYGFRLIWRGK